VLATCDIRRLSEAFEHTPYPRSLLADSSEEEYHGKHALAYLHQGGMDTLQRNLTFFKQLACFCLQSLQHRLVAWTKPDTTSLLLATLTDLARSKSEMVAENALLRQQLIILRRQVKRPVCTKKDRMLLVLLASMVRTWKQALLIVQPETRLARAAPGLSTVLEVQVEGLFSQAKDLRGDRGLDQADGQRQSPSSEQSASGANCSSWASTSANVPFRST